MTGEEIKGKMLEMWSKLEDAEEYYAVEEFAQLRGYSPGSIRTMIRRGEIPSAVRLAGQWILPENADILVRQNAKKQKIKTSQNVTKFELK